MASLISLVKALLIISGLCLPVNLSLLFGFQCVTVISIHINSTADQAYEDFLEAFEQGVQYRLNHKNGFNNLTVVQIAKGSDGTWCTKTNQCQNANKESGCK